MSALARYDAEGRIVGGSRDEVVDRVVAGAVADLAGGRRSLVVVAGNEAASEISSRVREGLVRLGRVESGGVQLVDGTVAGVGDVVQARYNDRTVRDTFGRPVANRDVLRVVGRGRDGSLAVEREDGRRAAAVAG